MNCWDELRRRDQLVIERQRERSKLNVRKWRNRHRRQGLCLECSNPVSEGFFTCLDCRSKARVQHKHNYDEAKAAGLCVKCFKFPRGNGVKCQDCVEKVRLKSAVYWRRRCRRARRLGLCAYCYQCPMDHNGGRCPNCREKRRRSNQKRTSNKRRRNHLDRINQVAMDAISSGNAGAITSGMGASA